MPTIHTAPLGKIAPAESRRALGGLPSPCWLLNLDQIEKETGYLSDPVWVDPAKAQTSTCQFTTDHVLYSKLRPNLNKVVCPTMPGLCTTELVRLRPDPEKLTRGYLTYFLRSPDFVRFATQTVAGAKMPRMMMDRFWEHPMSYPSIAEQNRLTAILDKADAIRRSRREADHIQSKLAQCVFDEMFASDSAATSWTQVPLGERLDFMTSGARGWAQYVRPSGKLFLRIQNVKAGRLLLDDVAFVDPPANEESNRTATRPGDVLLSITADLGRTCVIPESLPQAHISQHLALLRSSRLNPDFLSSFLSSPLGLKRILEKNRAAVKAALNFTDIRTLKIPEPPRELQDLFAQRLAQIHSMADSAKTASATLETLFQTLLERAFDGRLSASHREGLAKETMQEMAIQKKKH